MANPFLKMPRVLENPDMKVEQADTRVRPAEIAEYHPDPMGGTVVILKSGSTFLTPLSTTEVDDLMAEYYSFVTKNPNSHGVVGRK